MPKQAKTSKSDKKAAKAAKAERKAEMKAMKAKRKELRKAVDSLIDDYLDASSKEETAHYATKQARRESDDKKSKKFGSIEMRFNNKAGTLRDKVTTQLAKLADHERKIVKAKLAA